MRAGEKSIASNGKENALFPLEYLYMTQAEGGDYSHKGTYAIDFSGWGPSGKISKCPYYAPFDCHIVAIWGSTSPMIVWESDKEVNYIDGTTGYMCIGFVHDNNTPSFKVGDSRKQGAVIGHTGTYGNVTGDHVHIEVARGKYGGYYKNSYDVWQLRNEIHIYNALGVNDTIIKNNIGSLNWRNFSDSPTPPIPPHPPSPSYNKQRKKFPWVLYSRKLREKRR